MLVTEMSGIVLDTIDILSSDEIEEDEVLIMNLIGHKQEDKNECDSLPKSSEVKKEATVHGEGVQSNGDLLNEVSNPPINSAQLGIDLSTELKSVLLPVPHSSPSSPVPSSSDEMICGDMSFQEHHVPSLKRILLDGASGSACKAQPDEQYASDNDSNFSLSRGKRPSTANYSEPPSKKVCISVPLETPVTDMACINGEYQTESEVDEEKPVSDPSINSAQLGFDLQAEVKSELLPMSHSSSSSSLPSLSGVNSCGDMSFQEGSVPPDEQISLGGASDSVSRVRLAERYSSDNDSNLSIPRGEQPSSANYSEPLSKKVCTDRPLETSATDISHNNGEFQTERKIDQENSIESPLVLNGGDEFKSPLRNFTDEVKSLCDSISLLLCEPELSKNDEIRTKMCSESYLRSSSFGSLIDESSKKIRECFSDISVSLSNIVMELRKNKIDSDSLSNSMLKDQKHFDFAASTSFRSIVEEGSSLSSVQNHERKLSPETKLASKKLVPETLPVKTLSPKRVAFKRTGLASSKLKECESKERSLKESRTNEHKREKYQSVESMQVDHVPAKCQPEKSESNESKFEDCEPEELELKNHEPQVSNLDNHGPMEFELENHVPKEPELQNHESVEPQPGPSRSNDEEEPEAENPYTKAAERYAKALQKLSDKINKLREAELSLDDLESDNSAYIREDRLVRKFQQIHKLYCKEVKQNTNTNRPIQKKFKYKGSRYSEVNNAIEDLINKRRLVPDSYDIFKVIDTVNTEENLRIPDVERLAKKVFVEVMKELSERRKHDVSKHFTELLSAPYLDPIKDNDEAAKLLEESSVRREQKIQEIIDEFALKTEVTPVVNPASGSDEESDHQDDAEESDHQDGAEDSDNQVDAKESDNQVVVEEDDDEEDDDDYDLLGLTMNRYKESDSDT